MSREMDIDERIEEINSQLGHLTLMVEGPGWKEFMTTIQAIIRTRRQLSFDAAPNNFDDMVRMARFMSEAAGLQLAAGLVDGMMADLRRDRENLLVERDIEKNGNR